ncbi:hypothetical protein [Paracoccus alkanivorans]|nr:hypothetical protein [Paracoccus alkanivorans]
MPIYTATCRPGAEQEERSVMSRKAMQRLSFYLLVLLALYASLAGAA